MSESITRIVRLSFEPDQVETFLQIFKESKMLIRDFDGCQHLELNQDIHHENVYYTLSKWSSLYALEAYRNSDLFKTTWAKTKMLFNSKPVAYSIKKIEK